MADAGRMYNDGTVAAADGTLYAPMALPPGQTDFAPLGSNGGPGHVMGDFIPHAPEKSVRFGENEYAQVSAEQGNIHNVYFDEDEQEYYSEESSCDTDEDDYTDLDALSDGEDYYDDDEEMYHNEHGGIPEDEDYDNDDYSEPEEQYDDDTFSTAESFTGRKHGFEFKLGPRGLGYYETRLRRVTGLRGAQARAEEHESVEEHVAVRRGLATHSVDRYGRPMGFNNQPATSSPGAAGVDWSTGNPVSTMREPSILDGDRAWSGEEWGSEGSGRWRSPMRKRGDSLMSMTDKYNSHCFGRLLAHRPCLVLWVVLSVAVAIASWGLLTNDIVADLNPKDGEQGFTPRGTNIGMRVNTLQLLKHPDIADVGLRHVPLYIAPSASPTAAPSARPTSAPTPVPTYRPLTYVPTDKSTARPTRATKTRQPSSVAPTSAPTFHPKIPTKDSRAPSVAPTKTPAAMPTAAVEEGNGMTTPSPTPLLTEEASTPAPSTHQATGVPTYNLGTRRPTAKLEEGQLGRPTTKFPTTKLTGEPDENSEEDPRAWMVPFGTGPKDHDEQPLLNATEQALLWGWTAGMRKLAAKEHPAKVGWRGVWLRCYSLNEGATFAAMHDLCNGASPSVTVMRTGDGLLIGGTALQPWELHTSSVGGKGRLTINRPEQFLFSISLERKFQLSNGTAGKDAMRAAVNSAGMASEGILWGAECKTVNCSSNFLKWGNDFAHNEAKDGLCSTSGTQPYDFEGVSTAEFCGGVPRMWHEVTNSEAEDVTGVNRFAVDRLEVYVYRHVNDASDLNKRRNRHLPKRNDAARGLRRRAQIVSPAAKAPWPVAKAPSTGRARICPSCEMPLELVFGSGYQFGMDVMQHERLRFICTLEDQLVTALGTAAQSNVIQQNTDHACAPLSPGRVIAIMSNATQAGCKDLTQQQVFLALQSLYRYRCYGCSADQKRQTQAQCGTTTTALAQAQKRLWKLALWEKGVPAKGARPQAPAAGAYECAVQALDGMVADSLVPAGDKMAQQPQVYYAAFARSWICLTKAQDQHKKLLEQTWFNIMLPAFDNLDLLVKPMYKGPWKVEQAIQMRYVYSDLGFAALSFGLIFLIVWAQTGSLFCSVLGMIHIFLSFFVTYALFKSVCEWFPFLLWLALFVICGIGADDIFVYYDAYKQSFQQLPDTTSDKARMSFVFSRAASAMLITSSTTAMAFFSNSLVNPVIPIVLFGSFMGVLVVVNYLLVISLFPAVVSVQHRWMMDAMEAAAQPPGHSLPCWTRLFALTGDPPGGVRHMGMRSRRNNYASHSEAAGRVSERCFGGPWAEMVWDTRHYIFTGVSALAIGVGYTYSANMPLSSSFPDMWPSTFPLKYFDRVQAHGWPKTYSTNVGCEPDCMDIYFVFGVKPADTGDRRNYTDFGSPILDPAFPASVWSKEGLQWLNEWLVQTNELPAFAPFRQKNQWSGGLLQMFWQRQASQSTKQGDQGAKACQAAKNCSKEFAKWVAEGSRGNVAIQGDHGPWSSTKVSKFFHIQTQLLFFKGDELSGIIFSFNSVLKGGNKNAWNHTLMRSQNDVLQSFMSNVSASAPVGLRSGWFINEWFLTMDLQDGMVWSAVESAGAAITLSFTIILFATRNLSVTLGAVLAIVVILVLVVSLLVGACGWTQGVMQSMCMAIAVGICVDFVCHHAHAFAHDEEEYKSQGEARETSDSGEDIGYTADRARGTPRGMALKSWRQERIRASLMQMGTSTTSAAVTTYIAAFILMCFTTVTFFTEFGQFLVVCMSVSIFVALTYFHSTLALFAYPSRRGRCCCSNKRTGVTDDDADGDFGGVQAGTSVMMQPLTLGSRVQHPVERPAWR